MTMKFLRAYRDSQAGQMRFDVHLDTDQVDKRGNPDPAWVTQYVFPDMPAPLLLDKQGNPLGTAPTPEQHRANCVTEAKLLAAAELANRLRRMHQEPGTPIAGIEGSTF